MRPPRPRGPVSRAVLDALTGPAATAPDVAVLREHVPAVPRDADAAVAVLRDDDVQTALHVLYELSHRGLDGVDERWEWDADLLRLRAALEEPFEAAVRVLAPVPVSDAATADDVARELFRLTSAEDDGPAMSDHVARRASDEQARELVVLRSIYQLKEADPHSWALPRLEGRAKAALVEIQFDEYGEGRPGRLHAELYAATMRELGLDDTYGAYVDVVPASVLASVNLMSLLGLHRRLRGALVGHLAAYEMTSSIPCRKYGNGFRRLGYGPEVTHYWDEHVEADAVHEQIAGRDLAGGLVESEPGLRDDVLWGAVALLAVERVVAEDVVGAWQAGRSALREEASLAA